MALRGHEVQVLTGFPNYPGGKLYPGYKVRAFQRETFGDVKVLRVPLYPSHDRSSLRRVLNYSSFALSAAVLGTCCVAQPDVVYVYHPPATIGLPAVFLRYLRGAPFVLDIQDLWPDTLGATGMLSNPRVLKLISLSCQALYRSASRIAVLSPGFKTALVERGVPASKVRVIYNWCDAETVGGKVPKPLPPEEEAMFRNRYNLVFAGNMGPAQALGPVIEAAALLSRPCPDIQFIFIGEGLEKAGLQEKVQKMGLENVRFLPRRPMTEIGHALARADALLVHLKDDPLFRITIPSKTQAYLAAGKPVIMAVKGDAADLIREAGAGITCDPENPRSLAEAVTLLYSMSATERQSLGDKGRSFYGSKLSLEAGVGAFEELFRSAVTSRRGGGSSLEASA